MAKSASETQGKRNNKQWQLPPVEALKEAIEYLYAQRQPPVIRVIPFKLRNPSAWKIQRLQEVFLHAAELRAKILKHWQEDWQNPRNDGALAHILALQDKAGFMSRYFAEDIRKQFPAESGSPFPSRYYESIFRDVAQQIIGWGMHRIKRAIAVHMEAEKAKTKAARSQENTEGKQEAVTAYTPTLDDIYRVWAADEQRYQQAARSIIPFGRNKGQPLEYHGKREARWLLERLLSEAEIDELLQTVTTLLDSEPSFAQGELQTKPHPWLRQEPNANIPTQRAVRASRLVNRVLDQPGDLVLLGTLRRSELANFQKELLEMRDHNQAYKEAVQRLEVTIVEAKGEAQSLANLRDAIEIFLYDKPHAYPSVQIATWDDAEREQLQLIYETALDWFALYNDKLEHIERLRREDLETDAVHGMLRARAALQPPRWKALSFIDAMRPDYTRGFALLYAKKGAKAPESIVAALAIYKTEQFLNEPALIYADHQSKNRQQELVEYKARRECNPLHFVNYPAIAFAPPHTKSLLLFSLEYGADYQRTLLGEIIAHQMERAKSASEQYETHQATEAENLTENLLQKPLATTRTKGKAKARSLPPALVKSAKLLCLEDPDADRANQPPTFVLNVALEMPPITRAPLANAVLGLHQHEQGYHYAILDLAGQLLETGPVELSKDVDPALGRSVNTPNYVYAVANAVIAKAKQWQAYIGVEDTLWKKERPSLSRQTNRDIFNLPIGKIMQAISEKAALAGLIKPYRLRNISPHYDCHHCQQRSPQKQHRPRGEKILICASCQKGWQIFDAERTVGYCCHCLATWELAGQMPIWVDIFSCPVCNGPPVFAYENTAIVVAQQALIELQKHHIHAKAMEQKRAERAKSTNPDQVELEEMAPTYDDGRDE